MKRNLLLIAFLFLLQTVFAQDIIYTVSGELNSEKVPLDSILVENLSNNTWISFNDLPNELYYQINLTKNAYWGTTGIDALQNNLPGFAEIQNRPGEIILTYNNITPTQARFSVFNLNGQEIYSLANQTILPGNSVQVKLAETGVFLIRVESDFGAQSFKGIGLPIGGNYNVSVSDQANFDFQTKSGQVIVESDFKYSVGDSLRISVFKKDNFAPPAKLNILGSEVVNFIFENTDDTTFTVSNGNINVEGLEGLDFSKLSVHTAYGDEKVNLNGTFQVPNTTFNESAEPIVVSVGGELLFGIVPDSSFSNTVDLDNMLLFFFRFFPDIESLELPKSELLDLIRSTSGYSELKNLLSNSLNNNLIPLDNDEFVDLIKESVAEIYNVAGNESQKSAAIEVWDFKLKYERNGKISWPKTGPLYAYLGLELQLNGEPVTKPQIIDASKLIFSVSSILNWGTNWIIDNTILNAKNPSITLEKEGNYKIVITNGFEKGEASDQLFEEVRNTNRFMLGTQIFGLVVPFILKRKSMGECEKKFIEMTPGYIAEIAEIAFKGDVDKTNFLRKLYKDAQETIEICFKAPLEKLTEGAIKKLDPLEKVESALNIFFMARDYANSNIKMTETRSFNNGILYGDLNLLSKYGISKNDEKVYHSSEGLLLKGDQYSSPGIYAAILEEINYKFTSNIGIVDATVTKTPEFETAIDLPFLANVLSGEVSNRVGLDEYIGDSFDKKTDEFGFLTFSFVPHEDISEVEIKPAFNTQTLFFKPDTITLKLIKPVSIEITSEKNPNGKPNEYLEYPIQVLVKDNEGDPIRGIDINFVIDNPAHGAVDENYTKTKANGIAEANWKLGSFIGEQKLTVEAGINENIPPVEIVAEVSNIGTFTDARDGQTYKTVKIGNQIWFGENLNYNTGDGSFCIRNNSANCAIYGKLYTFEAAKAACPAGWHLPSDEEWKELEMAIGMSQSDANKTLERGGGAHLADKLRSKTGWIYCWCGSDDYGFSALPGGSMSYFGNSFPYFEDSSFWWTSSNNNSSEWNGNNAWYRSIQGNSDGITRYYYDKEGGLSVRCVKDKE